MGGKMQNRRLYKIGQVTKILGITSRTIRYYDNSGLLPHVKRSEGHIRLFDESDIAIIKKIREMQKNGYPLDEIRTIMFGKRLFDSRPKVQDRIAIVTDGSARFPDGYRSDNITVVPLPASLGGGQHGHQAATDQDEDTFKKGLKASYESLAAAGVQRIYSIHMSTLFSNVSGLADEVAFMVKDTVPVTVVKTDALGASLGLLVTQLEEAVDNGDSINELDIVLAKQIQLGWTCLNALSIASLVENELIDIPRVAEWSQRAMMAQLAQFVPVMVTGGQSAVSIVDCCKTDVDARDVLIDYVQSEIQNRGNYVRSIWIHHHEREQEAVWLRNRFALDYKKAVIQVIQDDTIWPALVGPHYVAVSIG